MQYGNSDFLLGLLILYLSFYEYRLTIRKVVTVGPKAKLDMQKFPLDL